jgi:peroxiredoxin
MNKQLAENRLFIFFLVVSASLNIGLAYKLHHVEHDLLNIQKLGTHAHVIGAAVNEIHASGIDGKKTTIPFPKDGPPTILYVFRPGCGWCAKNLPNLQAIASSASARHFRLIGLSLDTDNLTLKQYIQSQHLSFPVYSNIAPDERMRLAMGVTPQTLMIANAAVVRDWDGAYSPKTQYEIESALDIKLPGVDYNAQLPSAHR